ncbi:MAG: MFS transporter [Rubrivivax sp.]|nr:MFS transporter [Rubrivivax sp.]
MPATDPRDPGARDFPRVLAAEGVANFGAMLSRLAIPWLAALVLQATPLQMSALLVADVVAGALGSLLLASWVDRADKRAVMLWCDGLRCALLAALATATWLGRIDFVVLVAVAAAGGLLSIGFELARSAWIAQRIAEADLSQRNAQLAMTGSLSETAAFALGGWIYQGLGAALSLAVNAATYAVSALCLRQVAPAPPERSPHAAAQEGAAPVSPWRRLGHEVADGLRAVAARPRLRALAGIESLIAFAGSLTGTSYMIYVTRDLGLATGPLGMIFALGGLGAVVGAALAPALGRRIGPGRTMTAGLAAMALGAACIPLAGHLGAGLAWIAMAWLAAHQIVGDGGQTMHDVHDRTLRQTAVPAALLARADAGIRSAGQLATLAGALAGGLLGNALGTRSVLWLAAGVAAAAASLAAWRLAERGGAGLPAPHR